MHKFFVNCRAYTFKEGIFNIVFWQMQLIKKRRLGPYNKWNQIAFVCF